ncbi:MAG: hypothetical protein JST09_00565 [Bacteroidetes bacterium]|nr:hypothetical protein [Bacteroidota bacterium]
MKKMIIAAAMLVTISTFANEEKNVNPKALNSFRTEFSTAREVEWTTTSDYYRAAFDMNGQKVFAYYNTEGELMGLTRNISSTQLPLHLQSNLKKSYEGYWISDLFEVSNNNGTSYYVTLEDGEKKIVLKSASGSDWSTYKKDRKI